MPSEPSSAHLLPKIVAFESWSVSYDQMKEGLSSCYQLRGRKKVEAIHELVVRTSIMPAQGNLVSALQQSRTVRHLMYTS
jgi:hypothetical protein